MKLSRQTSLIAAGLLTSVSAVALFQTWAGVEARRHVEAALAALPGVQVKSVAVDLWSGRVALSGITAETRDGRVNIARAVLRSPGRSLGALISTANAADDSASADDIEIDAGVAKIRIPHLEASGTSLSGDELKTLMDPKDSASATERMAKLTASSITVPEVDIDIAAGEVTEKIVYHDIKLDQVNAGKIGNVVIAGATATVNTPKAPQPIEGSFGAMTATNLDLGLYASIVTMARSDANQALAPLYDSITLDSFQMKSGDLFSVSVGKMTGSGVKGRPFLTSIADLQQVMPKQPGEKPTPEQTKALLTFISDVYSSIEIGNVEVHDITVKVNNEGKNAVIGVSRVALSGMANARFGEVGLEGLTVEAPDAHVRLGNFAIRGFNFKSALDAMQQVKPENSDPVKDINPRALIPTIDQIVLAGVDADVPDERHQGNAADGNRDVFQIGKIEYDGSNYLLGIPTAASFVIDHVVADLPANDPSVKQFIAMGYPRLDLSSKFEMAWDATANELALKELSLTGANMAAIKVTGVFGNVTKDLFTGDMAVAQAALFGAVVKSAGVRIDNAGLVDKAFAFLAQSSGKSETQFKTEYVAAASVGIPQVLGDVPAAKDIANAVAKFIAQPKSLEIVAKSAEGIGAADLQLLNNPSALLAKLTVTATANQ